MHFLIIIFLIIDIVKGDPYYCQVGAPGKCLGDTMNMNDLGTPDSKAEIILTTVQKDYDSCANLCIWNENCSMASFRTDNNNCNLYRKISYEHSTLPIIKLFLWYCCNSNSSYDPGNRCPGFWQYKPQSQSQNTNRPSDPLIELKGISFYTCQVECLKNIICGAINYLTQDNSEKRIQICQLIIQFPVEDLQFVNQSQWATYQWQCAHNYTLPAPSSECQPRTNHNDGYWVVQNDSESFRNTSKQIIYFHTFNYKECLENCFLYSYCKAAWYSLTSFFCILEAELNTPCEDNPPGYNYLYTVYKWGYCRQHFPKTEVQGTEKNTCRTLINNQYTYIYPIHCGQIPTNLSNIYQCWKNPIVIHDTSFSINLHCQTNQSFRVYDEWKPSPIIFKSFSKLPWLRVYTGYDIFWLINVSSLNFIQTNKDKCKIFDASFKVPNYKSLMIIKRTEWFSTKPQKPELPYPKHPVNYVVISDTEVPFCNCFSFEACSSSMRRIQKALQPGSSTIPYSFIVTGDGIIYEARGWDFETQAVGPRYNPDSFVIALCGQYHSNPPASALSSVKKLIKRAVSLKKVSESYTLYIYNDIRQRKCPYDGLRRVIELWPHYRGYINPDCVAIENITLYLNFIAIFAFLFLMTMVFIKFYGKIWHQKNCTMVRKCRIESMYGNLFRKTTEVLPQILLHNIKILKMESNFISPFTSPVLWIEDFQTILENRTNRCKCKTSVFSIFDLCRFQSNLVDVASLTLIPDVRCCSRTIVFIFQRHAEIGNEYLFILHLLQVESFYKFIYKLHQNKCICDSFSLVRYTPSSKYFEYGNSCINLDRLTERKNKKYRDSAEKKFSILLEGNRCSRFYR